MTIEVTPALYRAIFEQDKRGEALLEALVRRFSRPAVTQGGIDAVLQTYHRMGAQAVIQHIVQQINLANGVGDTQENDE